MTPRAYYDALRARHPAPVTYDRRTDAHVVSGMAQARMLLRNVRAKSMGDIVVPADGGQPSSVVVLNAVFRAMKARGSAAIAGSRLDVARHLDAESAYLDALLCRASRSDVDLDLMNAWLRPAVSRMMLALTFGDDAPPWCEGLQRAAYGLVDFLDGKYADGRSFLDGMERMSSGLAQHLGVDGASLAASAAAIGSTPGMRGFDHAGEARPCDPIEDALARFGQFAAGHETPANIAANAIAHAGETRASDGRSLLEAVRFDPPIQRLWRQVDDPVLLDGTRLDSGQRVCIHLGLASRDARAYAKPDDFSADNSPEHSGAFFGSSSGGCPGRHAALDIARCLLRAVDRVGRPIEVRNIAWFEAPDVRGMSRMSVRAAGRKR